MTTEEQMRTSPDQRWIEREEKQRDLRDNMVSVLAEADDEQEVQFHEWSPGRKHVTIWNMVSGEEATLPRYQARAALGTPNPRGGYMWTAFPDTAPKPRENTVKCFLHPDSPERAVLDDMGITIVCMSSKLANNGSKRMHAEHRHSSTWAQYKEEIAEREKKVKEAKDDARDEALLKLATGRSKAVE